MGKTAVEKIISAHAGHDAKAGDFVVADVDLAMTHDTTGPIAITAFREYGREKVWDASKVVIMLDHAAPSPNERISNLHSLLRTFASEQGIRLYDVGEGVCHQLVVEEGLVVPGDLAVGADSHTCTYGALAAFSTGVGSTDMAAGMATGACWLKVPTAIRFVLTGKLKPWVSGKDVILHLIGKIGVDGALYQSMEFTGEGLKSLTMEDRLCMANMAIEAGAKNGVFEYDEQTAQYAADHGCKDWTVYQADADAEYTATYEIDLSAIAPTVSLPHLPDNAKPVSEVGDIMIDQAVIGSCTNGRIEDLRAAAKLFEGRQVHEGVRCIVIPATQKIMLQAMEEGLVKTFIDAGCAVSTPTCGPCLGGHMGILAKGERAVATTNRNFVGRMGHKGSEVYLASPAVAAASAIAGKLVSPETVLGGNA